MKILRLITVSILAGLGLFLFLYDVHIRLRYGYDINDVAAIDPLFGGLLNGQRVNGPVMP